MTPLAKMSLEQLLNECTEPEPNTGCYLWTRATYQTGRGMVYLSRNRLVLASRHVWQLANHKKAGDLWVLHRCDQLACVNPSHLYLGTPRDNSNDALRRGHTARGQKIRNTAKLSDAAVKQIRELGPHFLQRELAVRFGVKINTISRVLARKIWTHVT